MEYTKVWIIKVVYGGWDDCSGYDEDEYWTSWIFSNEEKAYAKCKELNKEYGHYGCGSSRKYIVANGCVIN